MPRLLILCEYPTLLGGERSMLATVNSVAEAGFDVRVAGPPAGPLADALRQRGIEHVAWKTHDDAGPRLPLEQLRADLDGILSQIRPDLVHANSLSTTRIAGPVAASRRIASLGHLRDIVKLAPQAIADVNAHRRLVAVSRATRDFHVQQGLNAARCAVVYNGIDLDEFQPRPATGFLHRKLNLPPDARLAVVIGQLGIRKGTDVTLAAAWQLAGEFPNLYWLIVGEQTSTKQESHEFAASLREIAAEPPLAGHVHFLGRREDVSAILNECDILVHAARQEPLGRVLLEAAASGLAIVAADVGGTREIFPADENDEHAAILVPPDQRAELADALQLLMNNDAQRQTFGRAARRRAEQAFDIRAAAPRLIEQYQLALASG